MTDIQGYAIRRNNSCLSDEVGCGKTWDDWHACCPHGSYCPGSRIAVANNVCCPSWTDCTADIDPPACANSTWNMYNYTGYFCCTGDETGFMFKGTDWVGCLDPDSPGNASYSALKVISSATSTASGTSTATLASTSNTAATTTAATSATSGSSSNSSSHTNTGAIAGGVVGGVAGVAAIGALLFFFMRRSRKQGLQPQTQPQGLSQQYSQYSYGSHPQSPPSELDGNPVPAELMSSVGPKHELAGSH
ncbi:hypothetical protein BO78DRAFT_210568 [Aspergillus sclerotiicarbonarius CBS 121057]|uniref:Uncharacterized protein n=1 Tax=Aspergillus sclerotiicarbonarius (strain CBS 121057 / IBT 28362) TaxID=1448318 RepID=A0A319EQ52_ASPSB|nr:hypothetical protein BO78DRAFT_210568 [Aspergillus sclerotiicarbonarius CBS 121057]